jgi:hypothetical protein
VCVWWDSEASLGPGLSRWTRWGGRGGGAERGRDQLALLKEVDEDVESSIGRLGIPPEVLGQLLESKGLCLDSDLGVCDDDLELIGMLQGR